MTRRSPFDFDISVAADKKRRARGRGISGAVETSDRVCERPGCGKPGKFRAPKSPGQSRRFPLVLHRPYPRIQSQVELLRVLFRRRPREAFRRRPGLGPADAAVRRGGAARHHPAACRGPGLAALRLRRPDGTARRQGDDEPGDRARAGRSAACRRPSGGRSRSSTRRTASPRPRSASNTRRWSRICIPT